MKKITTVNTANITCTVINSLIVKAASEAGIRDNENYKASIVSCEGNLAEILIETEWNTVTCYADTESGKILGLMAEAKSSDDLIAELTASEFRTSVAASRVVTGKAA